MSDREEALYPLIAGLALIPITAFLVILFGLITMICWNYLGPLFHLPHVTFLQAVAIEWLFFSLVKPNRIDLRPDKK